jgi:hypothetical protein
MSDDDEMMDDDLGEEADDNDTATDDAGEGEEGGGAAASGGGGGGGGSDEIDEHTIAAKQKTREELANDVEAFLARGGKIAEIDPNVTADPPKKPESDYRNRPI